MIEKSPLISVIVPVYNRENSIKKALQSILAQTYTNWQLIIVDDGSTDNTLQICENFQKQDNRIKLIHTQNFGVSHARNVGMDNATGEWIVFLDSDDIYLENALEMMLENSEGATLVMGTSVTLPNYNITGMNSVEKITFTVDSQYCETAFLSSMYAMVWAKMFHHSLISNLRFDENMKSGEDEFFMLYVLKQKPVICNIPTILYFYYNETESSLYKQFYLSKLTSERKMFSLYIQMFKSKKAQNYIKQRCIYSAFLFFYKMICNCQDKPVYFPLIVQSQLNENIDGFVEIIGNDYVFSNYLIAWEVLKTKDAKKVIEWYEKNGYDLVSGKMLLQDKLNIPEKSFVIRIAGINIEIKHKFNLIREKCKDYIVTDICTPDITTYISDREIIDTKKVVFENEGITISDEYAEYDGLPYCFYGCLPQFNAFWLHSVVIEKDGQAYAFSADPGTGKSTHAMLWLKAFPDAKIINGDNAIIRFNDNDGRFYAYGSPFCGKEGYNVNVGVPLKAICFLQRSAENEITPINREYLPVRLVKDNFCYYRCRQQRLHFELYQKLIDKVPFYLLSCNMDIEAAQIAYNTISK